MKILVQGHSGVRISLWGRGGAGKISKSALRDNVQTSYFYSLAKVKKVIYIKATDKEPGT